MQQPKNRSFKIVTAVALVVAVICLTVAYASLSRSLKVTGTADVEKTEWGIGTEGKETGVGESGGTGTVAATTEGNVVNVKITANLKLPGQSYTATIPVKNTGEINASLSSVTGDKASISCKSGTEADQKIVCTDAGTKSPAVKYTITYDGEEINDGITGLSTDLNAGDTKNIVVKVEYDNDATLIPAESVEVELPTFTFAYSQVRG